MRQSRDWSVVPPEAEQLREEPEKDPGRQAVEKQGEEEPDKIEGRITQLAREGSKQHQDAESGDDPRTPPGNHTWLVLPRHPFMIMHRCRPRSPELSG